MSDEDPLEPASEGDSTDESSRVSEVWEAVQALASGAWTTVRPWASEMWSGASDVATSPLGKRAGVLGGVAIAVVAVAYGWLQLLGAIGPMLLLYTLLFVVGAIGVPVFVAFMGPSMPGLLRSALGSLNLVLMQLAANVGLWLQRDDGTWKVHPGRDNDGQLQIWNKGEWRDVGNREYLSRLGMRPFGILREKTSQTWREYRYDADAVADGGALESEERVRYTNRCPERLLPDSGWTVDFTRVLTSLRGAGDNDRLDRAEEQQMKEEADGSTGSVVQMALIGLVGCGFGTVLGMMMTGAL